MCDSHDVSRGRGSYEEVLGGVEQPALVIGIESDVLYTIGEQYGECHVYVTRCVLHVCSALQFMPFLGSHYQN